jgi:hypothetical protein
VIAKSCHRQKRAWEEVLSVIALIDTQKGEEKVQAYVMA